MDDFPIESTRSRPVRLPIVGPPAPDAGGERQPSRPERPPESAPASGTPAADLADDDLHDLLTAFYVAVETDSLLAPYFIQLDMPEHMPRIVGFWSTMLFHTARYSGNAFAPHTQMPGLTAKHFAHWVATLERTVDSRFAGPNATRMKELAHRIAYSMQLRLGITPFAGFEPGR